MSYLKQKSDENEKAALHLLNLNMFASSIHCTYYSCFQLILHIFLTKDVCSEYELSKIKKNEGSHNETINKIASKIYSRDTKRSFNSAMNTLKKFRREADYLNLEITSEKADKATDLNIKIKTYLNKSFR